MVVIIYIIVTVCAALLGAGIHLSESDGGKAHGCAATV